MQFVQNFPFMGILLTLICAVISSVLKPKAARRMTMFVILAVAFFTAGTLHYTVTANESYVYMMGHFPAPWGNEIRAGSLEAISLLFFVGVIFCAFVAGMDRAITDIEETKYNIFCILIDLVLLALQALVYTNDIFTAFVFIEINTLAAAGLVLMRQTGRSLVASVRYMIMNLLGSSLFLIGIVILYIVTGHLLMEPMRVSVQALVDTGEYQVPLLMAVAMITVGLSLKSALFPFDKWLPGAYSNATPTASAILSSIVSKGYIFLLIKIYYRVIGIENVFALGICDVLFAFGIIGMIMGSVSAVRATTTRMMIAYSSVAQIGYVYVALGMRSEAGIICALWHIVAHALTKSMLFVSANALDEASGGTHKRRDLRGVFYRNPLAAIAFTLGGVNLVGVPLLNVFVTKVMLMQASFDAGGMHMAITLVAMVISTLLNAQYFLLTIQNFFTPKEGETPVRVHNSRTVTIGLVGFIALNLLMGVFGSQVLDIMVTGLARFA